MSLDEIIHVEENRLEMPHCPISTEQKVRINKYCQTRLSQPLCRETLHVACRDGIGGVLRETGVSQVCCDKEEQKNRAKTNAGNVIIYHYPAKQWCQIS